MRDQTPDETQDQLHVPILDVSVTCEITICYPCLFFLVLNTDVMFLFEMLILPEKLIANFLALLTAFTAGLKLR